MSSTRLLRLPVTAADGNVFAHLFVIVDVPAAELAEVTAGAFLAEVVSALAEDDLSRDRTVILPGLPQLLGQHELVGLEHVEVAFAVAYADLVEDESLEQAIQAQRGRGRTVLVTGVSDIAQVEALAGFADGIVVDVGDGDLDTTAALLPVAERGRMVVLVTGVRSSEQHQAYVDLGVMGTAPPTGRDPEPMQALLPPRRINADELGRLLASEKVAMELVDELITGDAGLTLALLEETRPLVDVDPSSDIESVRQALLLLGRDTVRGWAATIADQPFADRNQRETSSMILIRARFCQGLSKLIGTANPDEAFLAGLLAGVVDLLDIDPVDLSERVASSAAVVRALVHDEGPLAQIVAIARAHGTSSDVARATDLSPLEVMRAYLDAVSSTGRTMRGVDEEESDTDPVVSRPNQGELRRRLGTSHRR